MRQTWTTALYLVVHAWPLGLVHALVSSALPSVLAALGLPYPEGQWLPALMALGSAFVVVLTQRHLILGVPLWPRPGEIAWGATALVAIHVFASTWTMRALPEMAAGTTEVGAILRPAGMKLAAYLGYILFLGTVPAVSVSTTPVRTFLRQFGRGYWRLLWYIATGPVLLLLGAALGAGVLVSVITVTPSDLARLAGFEAPARLVIGVAGFALLQGALYAAAMRQSPEISGRNRMAEVFA